MDRFIHCVHLAIKYRELSFDMDLNQYRVPAQKAADKACEETGYDKRMTGFITVLVLHMDETLRWFKVLDEMAIEEEGEEAIQPEENKKFYQKLIDLGEQWSSKKRPLDILGIGDNDD